MNYDSFDAPVSAHALPEHDELLEIYDVYNLRGISEQEFFKNFNMYAPRNTPLSLAVMAFPLPDTDPEVICIRIKDVNGVFYYLGEYHPKTPDTIEVRPD